MTARTSRSRAIEQAPPSAPPALSHAIPSSSAVLNIVVRVAGVVPVRLDLNHVGTVEQQLGLSLGTVLVYLRSGLTARCVAEEWSKAGVLARSLSPAVVGRRPLAIGPSTVAAMVQLAGVPRVTSAAVVRVQVGPVTWEVCDATAYVSLLRACRHAARLLGDTPPRTTSNSPTVDNSRGRWYGRADPSHHPGMDNWSWTVGVLGDGSENVQRAAVGAEATGQAAIEAASDAAVLVAMDRSRQEYRIAVAGTEMTLTSGLTERGDVDLWGVHDAVLSIALRYSAWPNPSGSVGP
jgi:hypothetical protein